MTQNKFPEKIMNIDGVGNVVFKHSNRARHLNISVKPFTGASVTIPVRMSYNDAFRIVTKRKSWIKKHLEMMHEFEKLQTQFDENSDYCTRHHRLYLRKADRKNISVKLSPGKITVDYPVELNSNSKEVQASIRTGIEQALKIEAKQYLPGKVKTLAEKFDFNFNKLNIKNIKSRWGSCSSSNNINLSIHLMRLPEHLIDYIILHELTHTVHHNHSVRFWSLLNEITGGAKILDKELKKYQITIY